jgi:chemotaxis protein MotA
MAAPDRANTTSRRRPARGARRQSTAVAETRRMDVATILGLGSGILLIASAIFLGGTPAAFFDLSALLIVIGGTFAVTTICFSMQEIFRLQGIIVKTLVYQAAEPKAAALSVLKLAELARKEGVLAIQGTLESLRAAPFLHKAASLVIDGTPGEEVERILNIEVAAMIQRHTRGASVLRKAAEISPAMGLIGTLVGLVQMLGNLEDPATIGPSMAVALLTTFYGAVLANLVFSPLAAKLERNSADEALLNKLYVIGAASISRMENPRRLEMLLNTVLPPPQRLRYYD